MRERQHAQDHAQCEPPLSSLKGLETGRALGDMSSSAQKGRPLRLSVTSLCVSLMIFGCCERPAPPKQASASQGAQEGADQLNMSKQQAVLLTRMMRRADQLTIASSQRRLEEAKLYAGGVLEAARAAQPLFETPPEVAAPLALTLFSAEHISLAKSLKEVSPQLKDLHRGLIDLTTQLPSLTQGRRVSRCEGAATPYLAPAQASALPCPYLAP